jgi:hypothetical protein
VKITHVPNVLAAASWVAVAQARVDLARRRALLKRVGGGNGDERGDGDDDSGEAHCKVPESDGEWGVLES